MQSPKSTVFLKQKRLSTLKWKWRLQLRRRRWGYRKEKRWVMLPRMGRGYILSPRGELSLGHDGRLCTSGWKQHSESTSAVSSLPSQGKRQQSHMRGPGKQDQWLAWSRAWLARNRNLKEHSENIGKEGEGGRGETGVWVLEQEPRAHGS